MQMGPFLEKTVASFRLIPPTEYYVPPYKDPWRFWWTILFFFFCLEFILKNRAKTKNFDNQVLFFYKETF